MVEDDVMILDSGDEVYVWLGNDSDEQERKEALKLAKVSDNNILGHFAQLFLQQIIFKLITLHFNF